MPQQDSDTTRCSAASQDTPAPSVAFDYNGHTVSLNVHSYLFEVSGPAFEGGRVETAFVSALAAREKIDERVRVLNRQKNVREKPAIEAIDDTGWPCAIRGVHANTGKLLGAPEGRHTVRDIFPPVPWLVADVKRWRALENEAADLRHKIDKYKIRSLRGAGRIADHEYDGVIQSFQREFADKAAAALADSPQPERASPGDTSNTDPSPQTTSPAQSAES